MTTVDEKKPVPPLLMRRTNPRYHWSCGKEKSHCRRLMGDKAAQPPETGKNSRDEGSRRAPCRLAPPGGSLISYFLHSPVPSARAFFLLASARSTWRSAATLRFTPVSQQKKFASHLGTFSFGNRKGTCTRYCFPVIASNISLTFVGTLYLTIAERLLQAEKRK